MYVDSSTRRERGRKYTRHLLRHNYREGGKVRHDTVANLSRCSQEEIEAIKLALRHKGNLAELVSLKEGVCVQQGVSFGGVWVLMRLATRVGIVRALGHTRQGKLGLWQVMARLMEQGSRLSAVRLAAATAACDVVGLGRFNEDDLYRNLEWLYENQVGIEGRLFRGRCGGGGLFLYDVTSSYLEGQCNELGDYGYNRDGKKGKKQIVVGLLCEGGGDPVSIQVFRGNTQDVETFGEQVRKVVDRFGGGEVTFVGDRGMIKGPQIEGLGGQGFHYISALTKPQIRSMLSAGVLQLELFDEELAEVITPRERYILRRNPERAREIGRGRQDKEGALGGKVQEQNQYLGEHPRAQVEVALRKVCAYAQRLRISGWVRVTAQDRTVGVEVDQSALSAEAELDGCYVIRTDLGPEVAPKETIHDRYKDLRLVEQAFRTSKTELLEMRPVYVRGEARTRGYAVVVMLAYLLVRELKKCWRGLNWTVEEGIRQLQTLCTTDIRINEHVRLHQVPEPNLVIRELLEAAGVRLPKTIPNRGVEVAPRKNLPPRRKTS